MELENGSKIYPMITSNVTRGKRAMGYWLNENELNYKFEKMSDGKYQVRLCGEFVCYCNHTNETIVDGVLFEMGYKSRQDYLNECWNI
jgi:hypothetical protein